MFSVASTHRDTVRFGESFELDTHLQQLRRYGQVVRLERIPLDILILLVEKRGEIVSRDEIVARVWGEGTFLDTDNGINGGIRKIRQVLKDNPEQPKYIQPVTNKGYRFIAEIQPHLSVEPEEQALAPNPRFTRNILIGSLALLAVLVFVV